METSLQFSVPFGSASQPFDLQRLLSKWLDWQLCSVLTALSVCVILYVLSALAAQPQTLMTSLPARVCFPGLVHFSENCQAPREEK